MANLIRVKQLDQPDLSGFFNDAFIQTGIVSKQYVDRFSDQTISGIKTFVNGVNLNDIDTLNFSGVDITITSGNVVLTNPLSAPNLVYNINNQTISGIKTFVNSGIFSLSGITPIIIPNNPLTVVGSGNTYVQVNIQNRSTGTNATADLVITANNGSDSSNYIDIGINNSGYNDPNFSNGSAYDGYLFVNGGSLDIGTQTTGTNIEFHIGGTTAIRTIARITSDGLNIVSGGLTASNVVYNTGNQTISGVKTFNLQPILSGNPLITGVDLSSYATITSLASTGSTLVGSINSLSGTLTSSYATITNLSTTGNTLTTNLANTGLILTNRINSLSGSAILIYNDQNISGTKNFYTKPTVNGSGVRLYDEPFTVTLPDTIVYNTGNQIISGSKTFANSGIFSLSNTIPLSLPNNPLSIVGSGTGYVQVNIQNRSTGFTATSDLVITANNGTDTSNYLDLGVNNFGYNDPNFSNGAAYDGYLFINGGSLDIGTQTTGTSIEFHIGGTTAIRTIARITSDGLNIVSGTLNASNVLYITGDQNISGTKNFYTRPTVNGSGVRLYDEPVFATLPDTIVYNTGDQTINGVKTFNLQPILNGNPLITGNLSLYATTTNVGTTGSTLVNTISSLSGSSVLVYGNQNISGVKTFIDSGIFSNGGVSAVPLLNNPLSIVGSGNNYVQLNIQNRATGLIATADLVITANNGTDNSNFINLGINNSGYSDPTFNNTTGLDGYLIMDGGDLDIGTRTPGKIIEFHAGGTTEANVIARISQTGLNIVSGNLTVGGTGVLLSGQSNFILNFISNQATTNSSLSYFGNFAAGYGNNAVDRAFPVLENCVARKIVFTTQLASTYDVPFTTGYFINTTTNITGTIPITTNPATSNTLYNYVGNINVPISTGDNVVCLLKTTGQIPTFRSAAQVYCYK
jgi:hypothetical protein